MAIIIRGIEQLNVTKVLNLVFLIDPVEGSALSLAHLSLCLRISIQTRAGYERNGWPHILNAFNFILIGAVALGSRLFVESTTAGRHGLGIFYGV
jgi:hypothetical protein